MRRLTRAFTKVRDAFDREVAVGDDVAVSGTQLMDFRDAAFVYVDGEVLIGANSDEMHEELINRLIGDEDEAAELSMSRFGMEAETDHAFAAGYLVGDDAVVIAASLENVGMGDVVAALVEAGAQRVFTTPADANQDIAVTRVAAFVPPELDVGEHARVHPRLVARDRDRALIYLDGDVYLGDNHAMILDEVAGDDADELFEATQGRASVDRAFAAGYVLEDTLYLLMDTLTNAEATDVATAWGGPLVELTLAGEATRVARLSR